LLSGTAGDGGLTKQGNGTLTLSANNTYTGATTVNVGTLLVNGSLAAGSTVTVNSGATLGGNGTINGAAVVNGTLQPGNSPGVLTFGSSLTLGANSTVVMELNSTVRGTGYDGIDVTGALTYGGALTINVGTTFLSSNQTFSLFAGSASESGNFASVSLAGAYGTGSFTNSSGVWNRTDSNGNQWSFSQDTGNLSFTAVPEPTTAMLGGLGLLALGLAQVLRRRRA
jgi:autotransporter-associated beta strand protein